MDEPDNGAVSLKDSSISKISRRKSKAGSDLCSVSRSSFVLTKDALTSSARKPLPKRCKSKPHTFADSYLSTDNVNTRYLWKRKTKTNSKSVSKFNLHATNGTVNSAKLGHVISSENSLHALHNQEVSEDDISEDADRQPKELNNGLQDSKSNRMLQGINPQLEDIAGHRPYIDTVAENLPRKKNPKGAIPQGAAGNGAGSRPSAKQRYDVTIPNSNMRKAQAKNDSTPSTSTDDDGSSNPARKSVYGNVRRASKTVFTGKMEILEERNSFPTKSASPEDKESAKEESSSDQDTADTVVQHHYDQHQSHLHADVPWESRKPNSPIDEELENADQVIVEQSEQNQIQTNVPEATKFLTTLCRDHKRRKAGENTDAVLFCKICLQAVCYKCAFERHKDHDVLPLASAVKVIRLKMAERKREIENSISQMRGRRKIMESSSEDVRKRIKSQFERTVERLQEKSEEIMSALDKTKQDKVTALYRLQSQNETSWGQIDAVLKTTDDVKMLQEFSSLGPETINLGGFGSPAPQDSCLSPVVMNSRVTIDLQKLQQEIENIRLQNEDDCNGCILSPGDVNDTTRKKKKLAFKLDGSTAGTALRISASGTAVEYIGSARNNLQGGHIRIHPQAHNSSLQNPHPYPRISAARLRRSTFATVLSDTCISQGKQYWEVSVNRSMEYRLGVAYKHMQGTKTLADDHNSWTLCLTYPDRFSALNKGRKEYIFVASHVANSTSKVMRIGVYLDYEKGILSFYNASNTAEKRHLYTFRAFFNRPVWPLISLRQGKLQVLTGLPIPKNLVWKMR